VEFAIVYGRRIKKSASLEESRLAHFALEPMPSKGSHGPGGELDRQTLAVQGGSEREYDTNARLVCRRLKFLQGAQKLFVLTPLCAAGCAAFVRRRKEKMSRLSCRQKILPLL
jgi:hypothetical protein